MSILLLCACGGPTSPTAPRSEIQLLPSDPAPGSTVVVAGCAGECTEALTLRFSVVVAAGVPAGASLLVEVLDSGRRTCGFDITRSQVLAPGQPTVFESRFLILSDPASTTAGPACPLPFETTAVRATLIGDEAGRPQLLQKQFSARYVFVPRPTSAQPTRPEITFFDWDAYGPTGYHACPLQDESVSVDCRVEDRDGDALTVTLTLDNLGPGSISGPAEVSESFAPSPYPREIATRFYLKSPVQTDVRATCRAVDSRGWEARASLLIACAS